MQTNHELIARERNRSARFVMGVYAVMALVFAIIALTIANFHEQLALPEAKATLMAGAFATLAVIDLAAIEIWRRVFRHTA